MFAACPISRETRNEHVARAVAALVVIVVAGAVASGRPAPWILLALAADFIVRGYYSPRMSPLAAIGRAITRGLGLAPKPVDAAPKKFAARIGVVFSVASALLYLVGAPVAGLAVVGVLVVCATLEATLGYCVGCKVYALLPRSIAIVLAR
ncbi:MAG: DUF4395 domain-containing protein [Actinobacteria bacterium HGW-Actinobacteria-7]|jgi:hypothetical protein|nr:MAG: DUF4395 domain-containing protein [Actinobacteria bacterium HGW-Actinobacteria-7]